MSLGFRWGQLWPLSWPLLQGWEGAWRSHTLCPKGCFRRPHLLLPAGRGQPPWREREAFPLDCPPARFGGKPSLFSLSPLSLLTRGRRPSPLPGWQAPLATLESAGWQLARSFLFQCAGFWLACSVASIWSGRGAWVGGLCGESPNLLLSHESVLCSLFPLSLSPRVPLCPGPPCTAPQPLPSPRPVSVCSPTGLDSPAGSHLLRDCDSRHHVLHSAPHLCASCTPLRDVRPTLVSPPATPRPCPSLSRNSPPTPPEPGRPVSCLGQLLSLIPGCLVP